MVKVRIVCPYVQDKLRAETLFSLPRTTEFVDVSDSPFSYHNLMARLWAEGESFLVVEEDIEIHRRVIRSLSRCNHGWCAYGYPVNWDTQAHQPTPDIFCGLGCTRFSANFIACYPSAMTEAGELQYDQPKKIWQRVDSRLYQVLHGYGEDVHKHFPSVTHHHDYRPRTN